MIEGAGIDLIEVERIAFNIEKDPGFRELIFSSNEIAYCEAKGNKYEHYAARFAAKEAFFKALGAGWAEGTNFNEIEITNAKEGKPEVILHGITLQTVNSLGVTRILVSLSHLKTVACAVVIIEK
jgi:holo-[acyl-carrier protein] synthase